MSICPDSRTQNYPEPNPSCVYCLDEGLVDVHQQPHPGSDGMGQAPCPFCARGFRVEFAIGVKRKRNHDGKLGAVEDDWWPNPAGGPWGKDGYWQGRDTTAIKPRDPVAKVNGRPDWVIRWTRARKNGDPRLFPEMLCGLEDPPTAEITDKHVFVQPEEYLHGHAASDTLLSELLATV